MRDDWGREETGEETQADRRGEEKDEADVKMTQTRESSTNMTQY